MEEIACGWEFVKDFMKSKCNRIVKQISKFFIHFSKNPIYFYTNL